MAIDTETNQDRIERTGGAREASATGTRARVKHAATAARSAVDGARDRVSSAYGGARDTMADAYASAREKAGEAGRKAAGEIEENPMAAVVGGLALGAVVAVLLPRSERETKVLGRVGGKINEAAKGVVQAARDAGQAKIGELGLDRAKDTVRKLVGEVVTAGKDLSSN